MKSMKSHNISLAIYNKEIKNCGHFTVAKR